MLDKKKVEIFIKEAMRYRGDIYSQAKRLEKGYSDCSSIIQKAGANMGLWPLGQAVTTYKMGVQGDPRFRQIQMADLKRGDVLWYRNDKNGKYMGHVGIYLGDGQVLEAIYAGTDIYPRRRLAWQRAYRIRALESANKALIKTHAFNGKGTVKVEVLNVRAGNSTSYKILGQLKKSSEVEITGKAGTWFEISYKGNKAYVSGAYVDLVNDKPVENVPILINGKEIKKGYIIDGTTYISVKGKDLPVRKIFEDIGADVIWQNNQVRIII